MTARMGVVLTPWEHPGKRGPRARYSNEQAVALLEQACGADRPESFTLLDADTQRRAIRALRARSVPFAQLAMLTGMRSARLKRMQVSGVRRN